MNFIGNIIQNSAKLHIIPKQFILTLINRILIVLTNIFLVNRWR